MKTIIKYTVKIQNLFGTLLLLFLLVTVSLQVISRFIIKAPIQWTEEGGRFIFLWVALTGASISVYKRKHFLISLFDINKIKNPKIHLFLEILPEMVVFLFCIFMTYYGFLYFLSGFYRGGIEVPLKMSWVFAAIPVSGITMALYTIGNILTSFEAAKNIDTPKNKG
jgi:TRAP-type C4-dicarboxylate transport system permease small subunit